MHNITWQSAGLPSNANVSISVSDYSNGNRPYTIADVPASYGIYTWKVPSTIVPEGNKFKVVIVYNAAASGFASAESSNYFTILNPTNIYPITITSPNGGEQWTQGSTHNITWTSRGLNNISIDLINYTNNTSYRITTVPASSGSYSWVVGSTLSGLTMVPGQYKVLVYDTISPSISSFSNYFSIVATLNQAATVSLDPSSPIAQNIVINQTTWLAKFRFANLTGNNETINKITFSKIGTASDSVLALTRLYSSNNGQVLADRPTSTSSGVITFSGLSIPVPAYSFIIISTDITPTLGTQSFDTGLTVGLAINSASDITASDIVSQFNVSGSFPIRGNLMTLVGTSNSQPIDILNVQYSPAFPKINDFITTYVTVKNTSSSDYNVPFKVNVQGTTVNVNSLVAGAQTVVTVPNAFSFSTPGTFTLNTAIIYPTPGDSNSGTTGDVFTNTITFIQPSITVTSPNGGEQLTQGQPVNISWSSVGLLQSDRINIWLDDAYSDDNMVVVNLPGDSISYNWTVPSNMTIGSTYKISVEVDRSSLIIARDESNNYISVVSPIPIGSAGSFTSALDAGTPLAQVVAGNQQITAGKFKFTAANDTYTIKELKAKVGSAAISAAIVNAVLKDGSTVLATKPFDTASNTTAYFTGLNVIVPSGTSKVLTVDLILSIPSADYSTTGKNVKVTLTWAKYTQSNGQENQTGDIDISGNDIYVYKSIPTLTTLSLPSNQGFALTSGSLTTLYKFKVSVDSKGAVSLKQLKFRVSVVDTGNNGTPSLSTFKFFRGAVDITSSVSIQKSTLGDSLESTTTKVDENGGIAVVVFDTEETIPAGSYYEYSLKAVPSGFAYSSVGADSESTILLTDLASSSGLNYLYDPAGIGTIHKLASNNSGTGAINENIIWSDNSAIGHSYRSGQSSADWFNGWLITNILNNQEIITAGAGSNIALEEIQKQLANISAIIFQLFQSR